MFNGIVWAATTSDISRCWSFATIRRVALDTDHMTVSKSRSRLVTYPSLQSCMMSSIEVYLMWYNCVAKSSMLRGFCHGLVMFHVVVGTGQSVDELEEGIVCVWSALEGKGIVDVSSASTAYVWFCWSAWSVPTIEKTSSRVFSGSRSIIWLVVKLDADDVMARRVSPCVAAFGGGICDFRWKSVCFLCSSPQLLIHCVELRSRGTLGLIDVFPRVDKRCLCTFLPWLYNELRWFNVFLQMLQVYFFGCIAVLSSVTCEPWLWFAVSGEEMRWEL
jgi:hypothetical protein